MTLLVPIKDLSDLRQLAPGQRVRDKDGDVWRYDPAPEWTLETKDGSELKVSHDELFNIWGPLTWLREIPADPAPLTEDEAWVKYDDGALIQAVSPEQNFRAGFRAGRA